MIYKSIFKIGTGGVIATHEKIPVSYELNGPHKPVKVDECQLNGDVLNLTFYSKLSEEEARQVAAKIARNYIAMCKTLLYELENTLNVL